MACLPDGEDNKMKAHEIITEASRDPEQIKQAAREIAQMVLKFRENQFSQITADDVKKMNQLVKITGRGYNISDRPYTFGNTLGRAGDLLDRVMVNYRKSQFSSGQMPEFTARAPTASDMAQQVAIQTGGKYQYQRPQTWSTRSGQRYRDPSDFIVYKDKDSFDDAWEWLQSKGKPARYYDRSGNLVSVLKIGRYIFDESSETTGFFSGSPETKYRISVRAASSMSSGGRTVADVTDQQAAALRDIAATKNKNSLELVKAMYDVLQGQQDVQRIIDNSKKIDPRDKAKLDSIIASAGDFREQ
jgi:hypothetical protein